MFYQETPAPAPAPAPTTTATTAAPTTPTPAPAADGGVPGAVWGALVTAVTLGAAWLVTWLRKKQAAGGTSPKS